MNETTITEKADELIELFSSGSANENALKCVNVILDDLKESFEVAQELHPHAQGLIAGSLNFYFSVVKI